MASDPDPALLWQAIAQLAALDHSVTAFEAAVLETLRRTKRCSPKQRAIVCQMVERYLHDPLLAAELQGQQRLFA